MRIFNAIGAWWNNQDQIEEEKKYIEQKLAEKAEEEEKARVSRERDEFILKNTLEYYRQQLRINND